MDCKKTCKKYFRTGETACKRCSKITEVEETDEGLDIDGDEETEEDEETDEDPFEEDDFGNTGEKLFWVPVRFRKNGSDIIGRVKVAADNEDDARERVEDLSVEDVLDGYDSAEEADANSDCFILDSQDDSDANSELETDPDRDVVED